MTGAEGAVVGAGLALLVLGGVVLVVDHFYGPMPVIRKARGWLVAAMGLVLALLSFGLLRRRKPDPGPEPEPEPKPQEFDDAKTIENEQAAADTDAKPDADAAVDAVIGDILSERPRSSESGSDPA